MTHPFPPSDLADRDLPIERVAGPWHRIHRANFGPIYFARTADYRFNAPNGSFGVLYVGEDLACAFVETFARDLDRPFYVTEEELAGRAYAVVRSNRPLNVVDLTGEGLHALRADGNLTTMDDYSVPQAWSLALRAHPSAPDGVRYRARHDLNRICLALFDHVQSALTARRLGRLKSPKNLQRIATVLELYQFALVPAEAPVRT